jgi:hypothetical protein
MDSPIARSLISSLAFKSLTSGAFNFFRAGICFPILHVYSAVWRSLFAQSRRGNEGDR